MLGYIRLLPNIITASRIPLTAGFVGLLLLTDHEAITDPQALAGEVWKLNLAFIAFVSAGITDIIDGPLARYLKVTSQFGRSFDPLVDKILVGGGYILLGFFNHEVTHLQWWMVGLILAREILVTIGRSVSEAKGQAFGASWVGKVKMFLQSFAIGTIIYIMAHLQGVGWAMIFLDVAIWAAVIFTGVSALTYLYRFIGILRR
jgi:CDP-diacylglycerol--glycerol-3-phosphate 3-phosphatidyltransferase